KHLTRTRLLLHIVDMASDEDVLGNARTLLGELQKYSAELADRERWLVLNKLDLLEDAEADLRCTKLIEGLQWQNPVFRISALRRDGTKELCQTVYAYLEARDREQNDDT
ncbi:MAG: GTPase ObgE, partial [Gammaproteobacteria bacterium]|nr:GTPase ObgE [Gammaproteobacteria bacterium]